MIYEQTVSSSCCKDSDSSPGSFKFNFIWPLKTNGNWGVAVKQLSIPKYWFNVTTPQDISFVSNGSVIGRTTIPQGCYENVKVLIDIILKRTEDALKCVKEVTQTPHIWYDSPSSRCFIATGTINKTNTLATIFSENLQSMLGLDEDQNREKYQTFVKIFCGANGPDLNPESEYASIMTNLARSPLDKVSYKSPKATRKSNDLRFHPLRLQAIDHIQIELVDEKGEPVIIKKGDTTVKFVFKSLD
jgi:hypothetical protein